MIHFADRKVKMNNPAEIKKIFRRELREKCKNLSPTWRCSADAAINDRLMSGDLWRGITRIAVYASDGSEPDLKPFVQWAFNCGKKIFLPRYRKESQDYELAEIHSLTNDLISGKYGITEPAPHLRAADSCETAHEIAWVIPGVGFDSAGVRLGRGKGFYDRLLEGVNGRILGVFYQFQLKESIPAEEHDRKMDCAVTEENLYIFAN